MTHVAERVNEALMGQWLVTRPKMFSYSRSHVRTPVQCFLFICSNRPSTPFSGCIAPGRYTSLRFLRVLRGKSLGGESEPPPALPTPSDGCRVTTVTLLVGPSTRSGIALIDEGEEKIGCSFSYAKSSNHVDEGSLSTPGLVQFQCHTLQQASSFEPQSPM